MSDYLKYILACMKVLLHSIFSFNCTHFHTSLTIVEGKKYRECFCGCGYNGSKTMYYYLERLRYQEEEENRGD